MTNSGNTPYSMKCARANARRLRAVGQAFEVRAKMAAKDVGARRGMLGVSERVRKWRAQAIFAAMEGPGRGVQGGHREDVGHPRREVARAAVRERKESGWEGSMLFPAAWPGRRLQRRRPVSFPGPTLLAEVHSVPPLAHQGLRARRVLSVPRLREPRRAPRTAGISRRSRHRIHSGTSCKSARPLSLMLV